MTIKEFSDKYQIPYNIAFKASYVVKPVETFRHDKEYDEEELRQEALKYATKMTDKYSTLTSTYFVAMQNLSEKK